MRARAHEPRRGVRPRGRQRRRRPRAHPRGRPLGRAHRARRRRRDRCGDRAGPAPGPRSVDGVGLRAVVRARPDRRAGPRGRGAGARARRHAARDACAPHGHRDRWRRAVLRGDDEPGRLHRRRDRDGAACGRRGRRRRVHAVPPDCAAPPFDAAAVALGGTARGRRDPARRARCGVHGRRAPAGRSRAARRRGPRDHAPAQRGRPRPPLARRDTDRATSRRGSRRSSPRAVPPGSTPTATGCRSRRRRTTCRAGSASISTARPPSRGCGRAARRPAPACTARTGSRRTPCSTGSSSGRAPPAPSQRDKFGPDPTGVLRGVDAPPAIEVRWR